MAKKIKKGICDYPCPAWLGWLTLLLGVLLILQDLGYLGLRGLSWGPLFLVLLGLWSLSQR